MAYRDPEKQKEANREAIRRYREKQKGITLPVIPRENVIPVIPDVIPSNVIPVIPSDHLWLKVMEKLGALERWRAVAEPTIESLAEQMADLSSGREFRMPEGRGTRKSALDELPLSKARQVGRKGS